MVGITATSTGNGYWLVGADGGIFNFGDAGFLGSEGNKQLNAPMVGITATSTGNGYWLVGADGGIFNFGDAGFLGSEGGSHLNAPVVGIARTPTRRNPRTALAAGSSDLTSVERVSHYLVKSA
jgi:hypothetical protein